MDEEEGGPRSHSGRIPGSRVELTVTAASPDACSVSGTLPQKQPKNWNNLELTAEQSSSLLTRKAGGYHTAVSGCSSSEGVSRPVVM